MLYAVKQVEKLTPDILFFSLEPASENSLYFLAGQYVYLTDPHSKVTLPFSIASLPQGSLQFYFRLNLDDSKVIQFAKALIVGNQLAISLPQGNCSLPEFDTPILFAAGGTGISQPLALLSALTMKQFSSTCRLYWSVRQESDFFLKQDLDHYVEVLKDFQYTVSLTRESNTWPYARGYCYELIVADSIPLSETEVYVSGPYEMVRDTIINLQVNGLNRNKVHTDMGF